MHGDEGELEAAGEEAEHQQHVAAMAEGLAQRLLGLICSLAAGRRLRPGGVASDERQRQHQQHGAGEHQERGLPGKRVDQRMRERRIEELAERARRGAGAEGEGAPVLRHELAERADHHRERAAGKAEADHARRPTDRASPSRSRWPSRRDRRRRGSRRRTARAPGRSGRRRRRRTAAPRPTAGSAWRWRTRRSRGPSRARTTSASGTGRAPSAARRRSARWRSRPRSARPACATTQPSTGVGAVAVDMNGSPDGRRRRSWRGGEPHT